MEYRGKDWNNPYPNRHYTEVGELQWEIDQKQRSAYESGASAMGEHILSLLKEKAPSSVVVDILEGKR